MNKKLVINKFLRHIKKKDNKFMENNANLNLI